ncbi:tetratricopeptide repeat protein [Pseudomonas songnenensis]|uniref:Tetratricopeptide repeat protein n=1 Tax=Pseudomonas songnenensis TaxID=1176259 RepID=A0A482UJF8_9PSED|nr:tetratricopeptide repeat protein [Pseudomonas songnenensis]MCQ4301577.1 tetratricopeptide repeat protein [Pseudomonas songnenensis]RMH99942.1 tetratricopeptide repeat protein [Pseudomonas songnenensis]RYJ63670.1 tetratricopeptide repeat protein [Pseudomonas songnenensis]
MAVVTAVVLIQGCATVDRRSIPVVDSGAPVSEEVAARQGYRAPPAPTTAAPRQQQEDSGVVVMVPQGSSAPLETFAAPDVPFAGSGGATGANQPAWQPAPSISAPASTPQPSMPSGIPRAGSGLAADEQLDGPVLALLTTAQQQQGGGDLNGAASSLERAQRIAPREPQVLYRLAQVRLAQGDATQAEQLSRRALSYASGRPALQASLWELIAQARERQGDSAGAAQARERAKVSL